MMRRQIRMIFMAFCAMCALTWTGCGKDYKITVSENTVWFSAEEGSQTIEVTSEGKWSIKIDNNAKWFTVSPSSGNAGTSTVTIHANAYDGSDYRDASFTIVAGRRSSVKVRVTQNLLEFDDVTNIVFGVSKVEHWNTDAFNNLVEDSYVMEQFNPADTATGFTMYFTENGVGVQVAHKTGSVQYFVFTYVYDMENRLLHIEYEAEDPNTLLTNDTRVTTATAEMFRFEHEYWEHFWERAEMKKIGTINPDAKNRILLLSKSHTNYKKKGPIFDLD